MKYHNQSQVTSAPFVNLFFFFALLPVTSLGGTAPGDALQGVTPDLKLIFCGCIYDFYTVYFTNRTLFLQYCALFKRISLKSSISTCPRNGLLCVEWHVKLTKLKLSHKYTVSILCNKSYSQSLSLIMGPESASESKFFSARFGVWSPKFSNPGVGVVVP